MKSLNTILKKLAITLFSIVYLSTAFSQVKTNSVFKKGDRICFIGNSITNNGQFYNFVQLYYATRYPELKLTFINCGISGDVSGGVIKRMDDDILVHKPTWSVVMLGMNDVNRHLYSQIENSNSDIAQKRRNALEVYRKNMDSIVRVLLNSGGKVLLEKPTVYEQYAKFKTENFFGVDEALLKCASYIQTLAQKYHLSTIDYGSQMRAINRKLQLKDSTASLISSDRVHPVPSGHLVMAYTFLKSTGGEKYVSKIIVNKDDKSTNLQSYNCKIDDFKITKNAITFKCRENSLPFPIATDVREATKLIHFNEDFNQEILQVKPIKSGFYKLIIDTTFIAEYSADELNTGINLAIINHTPQYQQAIKVMEQCQLYRSKELLSRGIKWVELTKFPDSLKKATLDKQLEYAKKLIENFKNPEATPELKYYYTQYKSYLINKPEQARIVDELVKIDSMIYKLNIPIVHNYQLIKSNRDQ